ncbi:hypothetical protein KC328_g75 [Hortaea werneckii]|nr:hypothetical protein KC328_g75 [Hortaea werneckii]
MALSLLAPLKNREPKWVMPQAFRLNEPSKDGKPNSRSTSARPETPQPGTGTPQLNAAAPEFKPGVTNGAGAASATGIEDGEVEEEKKAAAKAEDAEMKDADLPKEEEDEQDETSEAQRHSKAASAEPRPAPEQPPLPPVQELIPLSMDPRGRKVADRLPLSLHPVDRSLGHHGPHNLRARDPPNVRSRPAPVVVTTNSAGLIDLLKSVLLESHHLVIAVAGGLRPVLLVDLLVMSVREGHVRMAMVWQPATTDRLQCILVHPVVVKE